MLSLKHPFVNADPTNVSVYFYTLNRIKQTEGGALSLRILFSKNNKPSSNNYLF